jgi:hypothetical protein
MKAYGQMEVQLCLSSPQYYMQVWSASRSYRFTPKSLRYPLDRGLGGPQSRSGHCGEEKNFALPGIETSSSSPYRFYMHGIKSFIKFSLVEGQ